jgi:hypothetical protein
MKQIDQEGENNSCIPQGRKPLNISVSGLRLRNEKAGVWPMPLKLIYAVMLNPHD